MWQGYNKGNLIIGDKSRDVVKNYLNNFYGGGEIRHVESGKKETEKKPVSKVKKESEKFAKWVGAKPCIFTGKKAKRGSGADNMHVHHINGRIKGEEMLLVPIIGRLHSWGGNALHNIGLDAFAAQQGFAGKEKLKKYMTKKQKELLNEYSKNTRSRKVLHKKSDKKA